MYPLINKIPLSIVHDIYYYNNYSDLDLEYFKFLHKDKMNNCLIELNIGDIENDKIIDTSGNKNTGIMIGDYSIKKRSILVPLTREMNMKLPI